MSDSDDLEILQPVSSNLRRGTRKRTPAKHGSRAGGSSSSSLSSLSPLSSPSGPQDKDNLPPPPSSTPPVSEASSNPASAAPRVSPTPASAASSSSNSANTAPSSPNPAPDVHPSSSTSVSPDPVESNSQKENEDQMDDSIEIDDQDGSQTSDTSSETQRDREIQAKLLKQMLTSDEKRERPIWDYGNDAKPQIGDLSDSSTSDSEVSLNDFSFSSNKKKRRMSGNKSPRQKRKRVNRFEEVLKRNRSSSASPGSKKSKYENALDIESGDDELDPNQFDSDSSIQRSSRGNANELIRQSKAMSDTLQRELQAALNEDEDDGDLSILPSPPKVLPKSNVPVARTLEEIEESKLNGFGGSSSSSSSSNNKNVIKLKIQGSLGKKKFEKSLKIFSDKTKFGDICKQLALKHKVSSVQLSFDGDKLDDDKCANFYEIEDEDMIDVVFKE